METPADKHPSESSESEDSTESTESDYSASDNAEQNDVRESFQIKYGKHLVKLCVGDGRVLGSRMARESWIFSPLKNYLYIQPSDSQCLVSFKKSTIIGSQNLVQNNVETKGNELEISSKEEKKETENSKSLLKSEEENEKVCFGDYVQIFLEGEKESVLALDQKGYLYWESPQLLPAESTVFRVDGVREGVRGAPLNFGTEFILSIASSSLILVADGYFMTTVATPTRLIPTLPGMAPPYSYVDVRTPAVQQYIFY